MLFGDQDDARINQLLEVFAQVLELFVADILSGTTGFTGPVDVNTPPVTIPDGGATAALLGLGLAGLGGLRARFGRN